MGDGGEAGTSPEMSGMSAIYNEIDPFAANWLESLITNDQIARGQVDVGVSGRVGKLRGYGNAVVPQVAAGFIRAALEAIL